MYFPEGQLRGFANKQPLFESANRTLNKSLSSASTTIFLSHSHKDKELAKGLKIISATWDSTSTSIGRTPTCREPRTRRLLTP